MKYTILTLFIGSNLLAMQCGSEAYKALLNQYLWKMRIKHCTSINAYYSRNYSLINEANTAREKCIAPYLKAFEEKCKIEALKK